MRISACAGWVWRNPAGCGVHDPSDDGLTPFGRRLIARLEEAGTIVCCSHAGYRTALDAFAAARKPAILSHSNPRAMADHPRNVPDEVLRACAAAGGVVGINGVGLFLGTREPTTADVFRHLDYVVQLLGPDHAGIAIDAVFPEASNDASFSPAGRPDYWPPAQGYDGAMTILGPEIVPELIAAMRGAGYPQHAIDGICGGNFARVAAACWGNPGTLG